MDRRTYSDLAGRGGYLESSVKTTNFQALRAQKKELPTNPYTWERWDMTYRNGIRTGPGANGEFVSGDLNPRPNVLSLAKNGGNIFTSNGGGYGKVIFSPIENLRKQVDNELAMKLRNQDIDLGTALGEFRETAKFVSDVMYSVSDSVRSARKGRWDEAARTLFKFRSKYAELEDLPKKIANTQLAWSYAVKPILHDVYGAIDAYERYRDTSYVPVKVLRAKKKCSFSDKLKIDYVPSISRGWEQVECTIYQEVEARLRFVVDNPFTRALDNLGLMNPAYTAWNLVKLSFVVDWFVPVGNFLLNVVPPQGVSVVDGYIYKKMRGYATGEKFAEAYYTSPTQYYYQRCGWMDVSTGKWREKITAFPRYHLIVPDISLNQQQVLNGLALLYQSVGAKYIAPRIFR